ncbi:hypothetical protein HOLleu_10076 [Holothuria leucospilota]|uniref:Uncharacterized protein n=1 Tax=Holothuria leucospilota TaxID=206669 RepID=A0A9Q1CEB9_HOLLE|nr:hypothetical protein HOLleu_10076 [Holothuria leucospilota]
MFRNSLKHKTQPLPVEKRGAAKAIADILVERKLSGRKVFRDMATRVVALSPDSFKNELGNGVHSFSRMIENAYFIHPSTRLNTKDSFRDKLKSGETGKRKSLPTKETYGCVQWQPDALSDGETEESQKEKQNTLKAEFSKLVQDHKKVETLMKETYVSQRFVINQKPVKPLLEIREDWPYLFLPSYFESHFNQLTGTTNEKFQSNLMSKGQTLYKFFSGTKQKSVIQTYKQQIEEAEKIVGNEQCRVIGAIFILCEYFGEDKDMLLKEVEVCFQHMMFD